MGIFATLLALTVLTYPVLQAGAQSTDRANKTVLAIAELMNSECPPTCIVARDGFDAILAGIDEVKINVVIADSGACAASVETLQNDIELNLRQGGFGISYDPANHLDLFIVLKEAADSCVVTAEMRFVTYRLIDVSGTDRMLVTPIQIDIDDIAIGATAQPYLKGYLTDFARSASDKFVLEVLRARKRLFTKYPDIEAAWAERETN